MSKGTAISHAEGMRIAGRVIDTLVSAVERIEVAGSLRRGRAEVSDVELVCVPRMTVMQPGLFTGIAGAVNHNLLDEVVNAYINVGLFAPRLGKDGKQAVGSKFKRLWYEGVAVDLFSVIAPAQWGAIMAIRTGPAGFSHLCVTPRDRGGAMPFGMRQQDGALWLHGKRLDTPDEASWFDALGLPYWKPEDRSEERLRAYLKGRRR